MTRRLALVGRSATDAGAEVLAHVRALVLAAVPELGEQLAASGRDAGLVDVVATVPAPRRVVLAACREGRVEGASRVGRRWLATRAAVEAWLRSCGPRPLARPEEPDDELEELRGALARPERPRARQRAG